MAAVVLVAVVAAAVLLGDVAGGAPEKVVKRVAEYRDSGCQGERDQDDKQGGLRRALAAFFLKELQAPSAPAHILQVMEGKHDSPLGAIGAERRCHARSAKP